MPGSLGETTRPELHSYEWLPTLKSQRQRLHLRLHHRVWWTCQKKIPSVPKLQLAPKNCCNLHLPSKWLHTLTRFMYWPVRVSTWMESPIFTNRGTLTPAPVSVVAGFDPPGAWEPQESIQVCVLQKGEMRKYLISEENESDIGGSKELEKLPWAVSPFRPGSVSVIFTTTVIGKSTSMTCKHTMRA